MIFYIILKYKMILYIFYLELKIYKKWNNKKNLRENIKFIY